MKSKSFLLRCLLAFVLVFSCMPYTAFANNDNSEESVKSEQSATKDGTDNDQATSQEESQTSAQPESNEQASNATDENTPVSYTIKFDGGENSKGEIEDINTTISDKEDITIELPKNTFEYEGKKFTGWKLEDPDKKTKEEKIKEGKDTEPVLDTLLIKDSITLKNLKYKETVEKDGEEKEVERDLTKYANKDNSITLVAVWEDVEKQENVDQNKPNSNINDNNVINDEQNATSDDKPILTEDELGDKILSVVSEEDLAKGGELSVNIIDTKSFNLDTDNLFLNSLPEKSLNASLMTLSAMSTFAHATLECKFHISYIGDSQWMAIDYYSPTRTSDSNMTSWSFGNLYNGTSWQHIENMAFRVVQNSAPSGGITYRIHYLNHGWDSWRSNGEYSPNWTGTSSASQALQAKLTGDLAKAYSLTYKVRFSDSDPVTKVDGRNSPLGWEWSQASDGGTAGTTDPYYGLEDVKMWLTPRSYNQVVKVRYQNANGTWGGYSDVINGTYAYGTPLSWSRAQDGTYNAASISYNAGFANETKYVDVSRRTANNYIYARYQNADGSYGNYQLVSSGTDCVGNTRSWSRAQDNTYKAASASISCTTSSQTKYVDVERRTATNTIYVRYQNANGSLGEYTKASTGSNYVGQTRSWSRAQDNTYKAASSSIACTATNQDTYVTVYRKTATATIKYLLQQEDGKYYPDLINDPKYGGIGGSEEKCVGGTLYFTKVGDDVYDTVSSSATIAPASTNNGNPQDVTITVEVPRQYSTNTIYARYQNADGTYGEYTVVETVIALVGNTLSWTRSQDETYFGASGDISVTKDDQERYINVDRKKATGRIYYRLQDADTTYPDSYILDSTEEVPVGGVYSKTFEATDEFEEVTATTPIVKPAITADGQPEDVEVFVDIPRKSTDTPIYYRFQNADGTYPDEYNCMTQNIIVGNTYTKVFGSTDTYQRVSVDIVGAPDVSLPEENYQHVDIPRKTAVASIEYRLQGDDGNYPSFYEIGESKQVCVGGSISFTFEGTDIYKEASATATIAPAATDDSNPEDVYVYLDVNRYTSENNFYARYQDENGNYGEYSLVSTINGVVGGVVKWAYKQDEVYKESIGEIQVTRDGQNAYVDVDRKTAKIKAYYRLQNADGTYPSTYTLDYEGEEPVGYEYTKTYAKTDTHQEVTCSKVIEPASSPNNQPKEVKIYTDIPRLTADATIYYRNQNPDGSYPTEYLLDSKRQIRVGSSYFKTFRATDTFEKTEAETPVVEAAGNLDPEDVDTYVDIPRKKANVSFKYRLQNLNGSYSKSYSDGDTIENVLVGQTVSWTTDLGNNKYDDGTGYGTVKAARNSNANPSDVTVNINAELHDGAAYAVLDDSGVLTMFRSKTPLISNTKVTVDDIKGNTYSGTVYTNLETNDLNYNKNCPWLEDSKLIKEVKVADEQTINPINCSYWFYYCDEDVNLDAISDDNNGLNMDSVTNTYRMYPPETDNNNNNSDNNNNSSNDSGGNNNSYDDGDNSGTYNGGHFGGGQSADVIEKVEDKSVVSNIAQEVTGRSTKINIIPSSPNGDKPNRSSEDEQLVFVMPSDVDCVMREDGTIITPSSDSFYIKNNSIDSLRVSSLEANVDGDLVIVRDTANTDLANAISVKVKPVDGKEINLKDAVDKKLNLINNNWIVEGTGENRSKGGKLKLDIDAKIVNYNPEMLKNGSLNLKWGIEYLN